jgi:putative ABC transport system permease protein
VRDRGWRTRVASVLVAGGAGTTERDVERAVVAAERRGTTPFADLGTDSAADVLLAVLAIVAAIVTLAGVAISVSLAAAEGRADLATLAAVGAAPRRRRALVAAQALLVGGLGAVLGLVFGTYVALITQSLTGAPDLVVPWANLALTGLVVPLVAVAVAAACTPSRLPLVRRVA